MGRKRQTAAEQLLEEARSIELLVDEVTPPTEKIEDYWKLSLDLIDLVQRVEALAGESGITASDARYVRLRSELSRMESRIMELERDIGQG